MHGSLLTKKKQGTIAWQHVYSTKDVTLLIIERFKIYPRKHGLYIG